MKVISTVLCLLATLVMLATPAMACCMTGHTNSAPHSVQIAETTAPPCHATIQTIALVNDIKTPDTFCLSCDDCAVSSAFSINSEALVQVHSDINLWGLPDTPQTLPRPEMRLVRITGPPLRQTFQVTDSPLARFDTLLI